MAHPSASMVNADQRRGPREPNRYRTCARWAPHPTTTVGDRAGGSVTGSEGASGETRRSALIKGLHVLESVGQHERLSDIAARTDLSPSTVHRILADLVEHGWVNRDSDRAYRPGVRVHGLVSLLHQGELLVRLAQPELEQLRDSTGFTVHLAGYQGNGLVYIAKLDGLAAYQMRSAVG